MSPAEYAKTLVMRELSRRDFWQFCLYYEREFFEGRPFLKDVAMAFQRIEEGTITSLSVSMPPRAGKSYLTSLFCAWTLGRNPAESVMRNTCTATLYVKFSYDVRAIVNSDKFKEVTHPRLRWSAILVLESLGPSLDSEPQRWPSLMTFTEALRMH